MIAPNPESQALRIERVQCTDDFLVVTLSGGRTLSVPLDWYPTLRNSDMWMRANASLTIDGAGILWSALALEIRLEALLSGGRERRIA